MCNYTFLAPCAIFLKLLLNKFLAVDDIDTFGWYICKATALKIVESVGGGFGGFYRLDAGV